LIIFETEVDGASEASLARFLAKARREAGITGKVNVVVTTKDAIRDLNRRFRRKNKPTDVLSFPAGDEFQHEIAGDIVISAEIAAENAGNLGHPFSTELKVLLLHGVLHLAGYDHEDDDGKMERKERKLRKSFGLPTGLIERVTQDDNGLAKARAGRPRDSRWAAGATKASGARRSSRLRRRS
jgi:probable rRNA maturation factor